MTAPEPPAALGSASGGLLRPLLADAAIDAGLSDSALLQAMLDVERELAGVLAELGVVPAEAAAAIAAASHAERYDIGALGRAGVTDGNPVPALVRELTAAVPPACRPWVHHGATSQDILDTALMLLARNAGATTAAAVEAAADTCADLALAHRATLMPARTLGQQALPTTFGLKAAGWMSGLDASATRLRQVLDEALAVQLGGAVGTLAGLGDAGPALVAGLASRLDLAEPVLAWHTDRQRILELGAALAAVVAASGKVALDVELLAQTEVGEVVLDGAGGSSAMPHKRNPVPAVLIRAAAVRAPGLLATLHAAAVQEHERAAGGWHAEWDVLRELLSLAGGAAARLAALLPVLLVDAARMRANLDATGGLSLSQAVATRLSPSFGRTAAHEVVRRCARLSAETGQAFRTVLLDDAQVRAVLSEHDVDAALDPAGWLGSTDALIERALTDHRYRRAGQPSNPTTGQP